MLKKMRAALREFKQIIKEVFMPGENEDYGSSTPSNISTMSIVLGSVLIVAGIPLTVFPITMPIGATFLAMGGATVAGGAGYKIGDHVIKKKKEKKKKAEEEKEGNVIFTNSNQTISFGLQPMYTYEPPPIHHEEKIESSSSPIIGQKPTHSFLGRIRRKKKAEEKPLNKVWTRTPVPN